MGFESGKKFVGVTYKREQNHEEYDAMRRKDREVTKQSEIAQILDMCKTACIAMDDEGEPYRIWSNHLHRDISKNEQEYREILRTYEQEGDWQSFYAFYDAQNIGFADVIREYRVLYFMCSDYKCILNEFTRYDAENEYDSGTAAASRIAEYLDSFYKAAHRISYEGQYYEESYTLQRRLL